MSTDELDGSGASRSARSQTMAQQRCVYQRVRSERSRVRNVATKPKVWFAPGLQAAVMS